MSEMKPMPGKDGNKYVPYGERSGETSVVYFTRDLSPEGLKKIYDRVSEGLTGRPTHTMRDPATRRSSTVKL